MPLSPGAQLGPYEILSLLGKGGMGEVYKAHDTRLNRDVAIKTSAKQFSERFEREARAIAALNHPNICTLYDVGPNFLVMEYVEGAPLKGPYPLETALNCARQISSALEAAHDKAITHRDLKPGNIMLKPDGVIKVLDFGLAKFGGPQPTSISEDSPTLTMAATVAGTILGTAAYMAPEQARGKEVDKRADIWAFGVVLHEMLTGERLFKGEDLTETMAAVVMREADLSTVPHEVRRLLKKCLQKDPAKRLRDIGDVWELLDGPAVEAAPVVQVAAASKLPWIAAALGLVAALTFAGLYLTRAQQPVAADAVRFTIDPPPGVALNSLGPNRTNAVLSPDGRYVAFVGEEVTPAGLVQALWLRELKSLSAQKLEKTEGVRDPFWSPDSKNIAFVGGDGKLKRISISGGSPVNLADVSSFEGGAWFRQPGTDEDGTILFAATDGTPIQRIPASGGIPTPVTKLAKDEVSHGYPQFLPGGKRFLYFARGGAQPGIYVQSFDSEERTLLLQTGTRASFAPPDYLLFMRDNVMLSQRVDWDAVKLVGQAVAVTDGVRSGGANGRAGFSASETGALVYRGGATSDTELRWFTRDGKPDGDPLVRMDIDSFSISPDNKRAIVERRNGNTTDLWLVELSTGQTSRLTSDPGSEYDAFWSPDSRRIVFTKVTNGTQNVYQMLIGSGKDSLVYAKSDYVAGWAGDGVLMTSGTKLSLIPAPDEAANTPFTGTPKVLLDVRFPVGQFRISPDGNWVAYTSQEVGGSEIWVASYPGFTDRKKVSAGFGEDSFWRADGKELFFLTSTNTVASAEVKSGATLDVAPQRTLFSAPGLTSLGYTVDRWAVTNDGKRFLMRQQPDSTGSEVEPLYVILNWPSLVGK